MDYLQDKSLIDSTLESWVLINSGSTNLDGLKLFKSALIKAFSCLDCDIQTVKLPSRSAVSDAGEVVECPVGDALCLTKRPKVHPRVLFVGHMDTVFGLDSPFQSCKYLDGDRLNGPGAADMKAGLLIILETLKKWEASPHADKLGWQVIINPDEELGSPSSKELLLKAAKQAHLGIVVEPSYPNGTLVSQRMGSISFTAIAKGVSGHAGRDFSRGKNAVAALCRFIAKSEALITPETTINFGHFIGGKAFNIIPDRAICRIGIRSNTEESLNKTLQSIQEIAKEDPLPIEIVIHSLRPPKPFNDEAKKLFELARACSEEMGETLSWEPSGGVCDGNFLSSAGLPTIDTLGGVGGDIHTANEYVELNSIPKRIELIYRLLKRIVEDENNR